MVIFSPVARDIALRYVECHRRFAVTSQYEYRDSLCISYPPFAMENLEKIPEEVLAFCGPCERRCLVVNEDETGLSANECSDGEPKQRARAKRGHCVMAIVEGVRGMMTRQDGFEPFPSAR